LKTVGDRITYCRASIRLTRKELADIWGEASVPTLARWELNNNEPSQKKLSSITDFFCSKGLIVSPDWLKNGSGLAPSILNMEEFTEDDFDDMCEKTFLTLNQKIKNFIYYKVTTNFFAPTVRYGDYIGGTKITNSIAENINSFVFVVHENSVYAGFLNYNEKVVIKNSQGKTLEFDDCSIIAKVNWTAVRP